MKAKRKRRETESAEDLRFVPYVFDVARYVVDVLGWKPWKGQRDLLDFISTSIEAQFEKRDVEAGALAPEACKVWKGGEVDVVLRVESGHGFGKTKLVAGAVNWAFDCLGAVGPVVGYTFGTDFDALRSKLWKEVLDDRRTARAPSLPRVERDELGTLALDEDGEVVTLSAAGVRSVPFGRSASGGAMPGRTLEGALKLDGGPKRWVKARSTSDAHGKGKEKIHGLHERFWIYVVDEAEGVPDYVFNAINSNRTGGIGIVILIGNPRTRTSRFYRIQKEPGVASFRYSSLDHPNITTGREVIPGGGVSRTWIRRMVHDHTSTVGHVPPEVVELGVEAVAEYGAGFDRIVKQRRRGPLAPDRPASGARGESEEDRLTLAVPWLVDESGRVPVVVPDGDFQYQVLGVPPAGATVDTVFPVGRVEKARARGARAPAEDGFTPPSEVERLRLTPAKGYAGLLPMDHPARLTLGVDAARYGGDSNTIWVRFRGRTWKGGEVPGDPSDPDLTGIVAAACLDVVEGVAKRARQRPGRFVTGDAEALATREVVEVVIRVDGTGGYGGGVVDALGLLSFAGALPAGGRVRIVEVQFGASVSNAVAAESYKDRITELYFDAAESLGGLALGGAGLGLGAPLDVDLDLTDRRFEWVKVKARRLRRMQDKDVFRKEHEGRSPDDGDGLVLAVADDEALDGLRTVDLVVGASGAVATPKRRRSRGRAR